MKSEIQIRNLIGYLDDVIEKGFGNEGKSGLDKDFERFTSPITIDDDGKPMVYKGNEAFEILGNIQMAVRTLEWVLGEPMVRKRLEDKAEAERYKDQISVDSEGTEYIPDTSHETFLAGIEGHW